MGRTRRQQEKVTIDGDRLKEAITVRRSSQEELESAGVASQQLISLWQLGISKPGGTQWRRTERWRRDRAARILCVAPEWLSGEVDMPLPRLGHPVDKWWARRHQLALYDLS